MNIQLVNALMPRRVIFALAAFVALGLINAPATQTTIQVPNGVTYQGGSILTCGAAFNFVLVDQAPTPNPMANVNVTIDEEFDDCWYTFSCVENGSVVQLDSHISLAAQPSPGSWKAWYYPTMGPTGSSGEWADNVTGGNDNINEAEAFAKAPGNNNVCGVQESTSYHNYVDAQYNGTTYTFPNPVDQTPQKFLAIVQYYQTYILGFIPWDNYSWTTTNITP